jgi:CspA family cold shock protein
MESGYVKFFNESHGYGFLTSYETHVDTFFHFSNSVDKVRTGEDCEYEIRQGKKGLEAFNIRRKKVTNGKR